MNTNMIDEEAVKAAVAAYRKRRPRTTAKTSDETIWRIVHDICTDYERAKK